MYLKRDSKFDAKKLIINEQERDMRVSNCLGWMCVEDRDETDIQERRDRSLVSILLQKFNVPLEPIAPDLHLCKMNIGSYTSAHR